MQLIDGRAVYSATDLIGFVACEHLTSLEIAVSAGLVKRPFREDPELDLIARRGMEHERRFLDGLRSQGREITEIHREPSAPQKAAEETVKALERGDDVVYQAVLFHGEWLGQADFLLRVETPGALGPWSYEVYDTKLARQAKAGALLQLCLYTDLLTAIQGSRPAKMHVALGGSSRRVEPYRVADYDAYYRLVKRQFEEFVASCEPSFPPATRPEPVEHCEVCRWSIECQAEWRRTDDLSLVAGITRRQKRCLRDHEVRTRKGLAEVPLPIPWPVEGTRPEGIVKVREQARIQVEGEQVGRVLYELLDPSRTPEGTLKPNLGLLSLPEPSPGDLFLDMEGDPFAFEDGIDFLFGVLEPGVLDTEGKPAFHRFWSRDDGRGAITLAGEKRAFEQVIDFLMDRLTHDPNLHIYHYAPYEPAALGRLMGRYGSREAEVDRLLRGGVLVDLFRAVRQGLRASVEGYSIKKIEPLYGFERSIDLREARLALVAFSASLDIGGEQGEDPTISGCIEAYNRDDCVSNWKLRDWLEGRRLELADRIGAPVPRPLLDDPNPSDNLADHLQRVIVVEERLTANVPISPVDRTAEQQARWLLAQLLSWHRREDKVGWWRWFYLLNKLTDEERVEEPEPIGGLSYVGVVDRVARSLVHRYQFPPQEHDVSMSRGVTDPATKKAPGTVEALDNAAGTLDLRRGKTSDAPHPKSVIPKLVLGTRELKDSLLRVGEWVAEHGIEAPGLYRAARELLLRCPPRVGQAGSGELAQNEPTKTAARRLVASLEGSCLAIQGPPGSGKTTIGAEMIVDLVATGKRVGVTANSHKVIGNLLDKVVTEAASRGVNVRIGQKPGEDDPCTCQAAKSYTKNELLRTALAGGEIDVAGGTSWVWAREEFTELLDVLFVDEAGQMSLANVVAVASAAKSLVLLGDPQQLDQPLCGSHPPGAERSALAHLLEDEATMPPTLGLFLAGTWRLHPGICDYTSEVFYDGRLAPEPGRDRQRVAGTGLLDGTGIRYVPVEHAGNDKDSIEEAQEVSRLVHALLDGGGSWIDAEGERHSIGLEDVLVITPYNAQARKIADIFPGIRVGTVDKFQGQEAPISIYSMATSSAEEAPRGMEFLYSLHRLNVATSRARCLAVVVASPELIRVRCHTPRQMRLASAFARLVEMGAPSSLHSSS